MLSGSNRKLYGVEKLIVNSSQTLPKPPRLMSSTDGYDWNELDRWLQRLYLLLGSPDETRSKSLNIIQELSDQQVSSSFDFAVDHQHEIRQLDKRIDDVFVELNMIIDNKPQIKSLQGNIEDLRTELNSIIDHQQEIKNLQQQILDAEVAHVMG